MAFPMRRCCGGLRGHRRRGRILAGWLEEIFEDGLVAAEVRDSGGRGALVFVEGGRLCGSTSVAEIGGGDAVVLEDDGAFGAGDFNTAGIARIGGGSDVENAECATGKFEDGGGGVFGFDLVKKCAGAGLARERRHRGARGASRRCGRLD